MGWDEKDLRRALRESVERVHPRPGAFGRLIARRHRGQRVRVTASTALAAAAVTALVLIVSIRPGPVQRPSVNLGDVIDPARKPAGAQHHRTTRSSRSTLPRLLTPAEANRGSALSSVSGD